MKKGIKEEQPALSTGRIAALFDIDIVSVRRMLRRGELAGFKIGPRMWRIPHSELERLMRGKPKPAISGSTAA